MTTTDLKPGDIVHNPEWGYGVVVWDLVRDRHLVSHGAVGRLDEDLTGWERVEAVRPGHVQVCVDDLDEDGSGWLDDDDEDDIWGFSGRIAIRAAKAIAAQRDESTPPADEQDASTTETATYQCPWCSTDVDFSVALNRNPRGGVMAWVEADGAHTCPPEQPDAPTEFGARIKVTRPDGTREKWLRHASGWWISEDCDVATWDELTESGTITLGWDE